MSYSVDHPQEPTVYEQQVGHRLRDDTPIGAGQHFVHPDDCQECKDPETHAAVKRNMEIIDKAVQEIAPCFSEDVPHTLLVNIGMSFYMQMLEAHR